MAETTEFHNLALTVSLVDNASAGLEQINTQLKNLGTGSHAAAHARMSSMFRDMGNLTKGLTGEIGKLESGLVGMGRSIASTVLPALSGVGAVIGGLGAVVAIAVPAFMRLTKEMGDIAQLSRETGNNAATIKIFREEMTKLFGAEGIKLADQTLRGLSATMADIFRNGSDLNIQLYDMARKTPQMAEAMDKFRNSLKEAAQSGNTAEFYNKALAALDNVERNARDKFGPQVAAQFRNNLAAILRIPAEVAATHRPIRTATQEEIEYFDQLTAKSKLFNESLNTTSSNIGRIGSALVQMVIPIDKMNVAADFLAGITERIARALERMNLARSKEATDVEQGKAADTWRNSWWFNLLFRMPANIAGEFLLPPDKPDTTPQKFIDTGGGGGADSAEGFALIKQENAQMAALTNELKRLNDYLLYTEAQQAGGQAPGQTAGTAQPGGGTTTGGGDQTGTPPSTGPGQSPATAPASSPPAGAPPAGGGGGRPGGIGSDFAARPPAAAGGGGGGGGGGRPGGIGSDFAARPGGGGGGGESPATFNERFGGWSTQPKTGAGFDERFGGWSAQPKTGDSFADRFGDWNKKLTPEGIGAVPTGTSDIGRNTFDQRFGNWGDAAQAGEVRYHDWKRGRRNLMPDNVNAPKGDTFDDRFGNWQQQGQTASNTFDERFGSNWGGDGKKWSWVDTAFPDSGGDALTKLPKSFDDLDRGAVDKALGNQMFHRLDGQGTFNIDVGSRATGKSDSIEYLFKPPVIDRQTNMWPTETGPREQISPLRDK